MLTRIVTVAARAAIQTTILASAMAASVMPGIAHAIPFSSISQVYFFGDSLTDSGFNNLIDFGGKDKAPTFTTFGGYTWSQYVARDIKGFTLPVAYPVTRETDGITNNTTPTNGDSYGAVDPILTGVNYACGGSKTGGDGGLVLAWAPSLHQQIDRYLSTSPSADPHAVYFVWSGANDLLSILDPIPTELQLLQAADQATTNVANEVERLSAKGAKRVVVMSLPNIGSTPFILEASALDATLPGKLKNLSYTFDTMLNRKLSSAIKKYGVKILYINTYGLLDDVVAAAKAGRPYEVEGRSFTFVNYTGTACGEGVTSLFCPNNGIKNYVFADAIHPSGLTHEVLSLEIEKRIKSWN